MSARLVRCGILACSTLAGLVLARGASAQTLRLDRLPVERLAVTAPSERVTGEPGRMQIAAAACPSYDEASLRRRIVDIAVQEWGFFGFNVVNETVVDDDGERDRRWSWRRLSRLDPAESARVAGSIAGYWSATPDGSWILSRQNEIWNDAGIGARWRDPWSAAFISWVMCESGLGSEDRFRRHIAHHVYIDQAIEARDDPDSLAAFVAYDVGELVLEPGDMVCRARRGAYRSIAERRADIGVGVRSHCDIVVEVDADRNRILAIGGNVRGRVSLKLLPATFERRGGGPLATSIGRGRRAIFAHLKLRAPPIEADAFESTPTMAALSERTAQFAALEQRLDGETPLRAGAPVETSLSGGSAPASP
ncbi:MAG TPA: DUF2272 domain-containing protein [Gammaproteobacteria bacterium]